MTGNKGDHDARHPLPARAARLPARAGGRDGGWRGRRGGRRSIGAGAHPLDGTIWDIASGERIDRETLARRLARADIAILGEIHDNAAQHLAQAWLVGRLQPAGIAFEMIPQAKEAAIAALLAGGGTPGEIGPAIGWDKSGWPDWSLYRPIFDAWTARVYVGGGVPRETLMQAGATGAASVAPDPRFVPMLAQALDPATEAALEDEMVAAHCNKLPREAAPGMVEVQRLRDASFAAAALRAHAAVEDDTAGAAPGRTAGGTAGQTGGRIGGARGTAVLITGNGHARIDRGVPAYLRAVAPGLTVASLGLLETDPDRQALSDYDTPYDYVWFTAPAEREDPCLTFK